MGKATPWRGVSIPRFESNGFAREQVGRFFFKKITTFGAAFRLSHRTGAPACVDIQIQIHKVIITGTGRAGTTFLIRLLTELGLDTGYTGRSWRKDYSEHCNAGLERDILSPDAPYIVKNPSFCETLPAILATGRFVIDHALIPIRQLEAAALSRARIGGTFSSVPGGLLHTAAPADQKAILAELFHQLVHTVAAHDIPHTFLIFPRLVEDPDYAYAKLRFLLEGISREKFRAVFARIANPRFVHPFLPAAAPAGPSDRETEPARAYFRSRLRARLLRRTRRTSARLAIALLLGIVFVGWRPMAKTSSVPPGGAGPVDGAAVAENSFSTKAFDVSNYENALEAAGQLDWHFTPAPGADQPSTVPPCPTPSPPLRFFP